jgi:hypothetical protein|tara:strand:+ start:2147 stop:2449 length:303 start_codon:yes stop_codon:yes gene_type:complete
MGRYSDIITLATKGGKRYKGTTNYPDIPLSFDDIYVYTDEGDRFDILAQAYYSNSNLWWIISTANPQLPQNTMFPPLGIQIRIPINIGEILIEYNKLNAL